MKYTNFLLLALSLSLLTACGQTETPEATPTPTPTETLAPTVPPTETPVPETEPPLELDPGPAVYVDGTAIEGTAKDGDVVYVSAGEFCEALGGVSSVAGSAVLDYNGAEFTFSPEFSYILQVDEQIKLTSPILDYQEEAYLPLEELCERLEISVFWDTEQDSVYCTPAAWPRQVPEGYDVPVFMYHCVAATAGPNTELYVHPDKLEEQLKYLTENGYDTIFFEDLYHIEDYDKPVILTFDDGYLDNYTDMYPLLQKYNAKATIFIITNRIDVDPGYLTTEQLREMCDSGLVSIQSHTVTHPDLDSLTLEEQQVELEQSKLEITRFTLREPYVLCFPTGKYDSNTLSLMEGNYAFGLKMRGGLYNTSQDSLEINRYYVARSYTIAWFKGVMESVFGAP